MERIFSNWDTKTKEGKTFFSLLFFQMCEKSMVTFGTMVSNTKLPIAPDSCPPLAYIWVETMMFQHSEESRKFSKCIPKLGFLALNISVKQTLAETGLSKIDNQLKQ